MAISIQLNNKTFNINSYSRITTIDTSGTRSTATVGFVDNSGYDDLVSLGEITSLNIKVNGTSVYALTGIHANITTINERLADDAMLITAQIAFELSSGT